MNYNKKIDLYNYVKWAFDLLWVWTPLGLNEQKIITFCNYLFLQILMTCAQNASSPVIIQMRCLISACEIIRKLPTYAGFSLQPAWNHVIHQTDSVPQLPSLKLKYHRPGGCLTEGEKERKKYESACWCFKPLQKPICLLSKSLWILRSMTNLYKEAKVWNFMNPKV